MTHPLFDRGRVAVITGAARGIGRSAALKFARRGMQLVLADVLADELAETAAAAEAAGSPAALAVPTDVGDYAAVSALRDRAFERFGVVNVLMNNAAIGIRGGAFEDHDNWQRLMAVNLWGVINGLQAFVPKMLATGADGLVINTGSKQGITCPPGNAAYNASKAAVNNWTLSLAYELRATPIKVNTVHPGYVRTDMNAGEGEIDVADGARSSVQMALLGADGPSGSFTHLGQVLPW